MNQTSQVLKLATKNHWGLRIVANGPMIEKPVNVNDWVFIPIEEDKSMIPEEALKRVEEIKKDFKIQGLIVAHEAPKLLSAPQPKKTDESKNDSGFTDAMVSVLGVILATMAFFFTALFSILLDPALIVVLDDGTWVEVMRWVE